MNFNLYNSVLFAGILQGFIFAFVVGWNKKYNTKSNFYLASLIVSFSLNNLQYYIADIGLISSEFFYNYVFIPWCLIIPAFFYQYISQSLFPESKSTFKQKLLFVPFYIGLFLSVLYKVFVGLNYREEVLNFFYPIPNIIEFLAIIFNQIIYTVVFFHIRKIEKTTRNFNANSIQIRLNWLKKIIVFLFILSFIWLFLMVKTVVTDTKVNFYALWIGISILIYWLGYIGIYKFGIIEERKNLKKYAKETNTNYSIVEKQKSNHIISFEHLIHNQKRFLDSDLTLDAIAEELNLSKSYLSRTINAELGTGFVEYVNSLRIEEAKSYLINPDFSNYTLEAIGLEAGFNSKSAFYSSFKKITGLTPSEFKKDTTNLS
ncbi:MAG: helix-turn-helix transcriptional regulator [Flavobacterium sp.]|nr:helix-turn-helix transcriptional regulator [Flavobacterium sp.]